MKTLLMGATILALGITSASAQQLEPAARPAAEPMIRTDTQAQTQAQTQSQTSTPARTTTLSPEENLATGVGVGLFYGYNMQDSGRGNSHLGGVNLDYEYGLTQGLALQLQQAVFYNYQAESDGIGGRSVAGLKLNMGASTSLVPYVGANFGGIYGKGITDSLLAGPEIGINLFGLNAKVAYDMPFDRSWDDGVVVTTVGFGMRF